MQLLFQTFIEFLYAPFIYPELLWILLPLLLAIVLMELYFKRYSRESIGHHKSLESTIFLLFICFNLFSLVLKNNNNSIKFYTVVAYTVFCIIIGFMDFMHKLPTKLLFRRSSKFIVAYISYVAIVLVYSNILVSLSLIKAIYILISIVLLFATFVGVKYIFVFLEPKSYEEIEHFLHGIEEDIRKAHEDTNKEFKKTKPTKTKNTSKKKK